MSKAQKMIQNLDQLQITLKPYEKHYLQKLEQPTRALYLQMLYSVVSLSHLNNTQNRVWELLSQSIDADDVSTDEMGIELIKKFVEDAVANELEYCFILDLLVLLRLNSVSKDQAKVVAELMSILKLDDEDLSTLIHLSNLILKIEDKVQNLVEFDYQTVRHWHEFSYQVLTENILTENFIAGNWLLTQDFMDINKTIEIQDSTFACLGATFTIGIENSRIRSYRCAFKNDFKLENCDAVFETNQFYNTSMWGGGFSNNLVFTKSVFENEFIASDILQSYFIMERGQYEFTDNEFKLINISVIESMECVQKLNITNCSFNNTGNPLGYGSVRIFHRGIQVVDSTFNKCTALNSAAALSIKVNTRSESLDTKILIKDNIFTESNSIKDFDKKISFIGIAVDYESKAYLQPSKLNSFLENNKLNNTNTLIYLRHYAQREMGISIIDSSYSDSQVFYIKKSRYSDESIDFVNCTFNNKKLENLVEVVK